MPLNEEQTTAFKEVQKGTSIFLTGNAGSGKSFLLSAIIDWANENKKNIGVTSSTGISAINLKGRTVHSYLGIGLAKTTPYNLFTKARKNSLLKKKLSELQILIIDEISMISAELLDKISEYLILMRKNNKPFGELQLVLCGDMCQLPPVGGEYCFKSNVWPVLNLKVHMLRIIIRQEKDERFKAILEEARFGRISDENFKLLKSLNNTTFGEIKPTILFSKNVNVDAINQLEYQKLKETGVEERTFATRYVPNTTEMREWAALNNIPSEIKLCVGCQLLITTNLAPDLQIANGTRCMVSGFTPQDEPIVVLKTGEQIIIEPYVFLEDDDEKNPRFACALPLRLAWAITIHKSQSATLDAAVLDLGFNIFEYGQAYTALSRVRDLHSLRISSIRKESFKTHRDVLEFYGQIA